MKRIKNFESFDFSQTLPVTSVDLLTTYHSCDECDGIWKEFNEDVKSCKYCGSEEIEELEKSEFYEISKTRTDDLESLEKEMEEDKDSFVDLINLKSKRNYGN